MNKPMISGIVSQAIQQKPQVEVQLDRLEVELSNCRDSAAALRERLEKTVLKNAIELNAGALSPGDRQALSPVADRLRDLGDLAIQLNHVLADALERLEL